MKTLRSRRHRALCAALVAARKTARLSQQDVADRIKTSQTVIARIETGERRIDVIEFIDIVHALGQDPHKLLDEVM